MNSPCRKSASISSIALLTLVTFVSRVAAQTSTHIDLQIYAGLSISGEVGEVYSVEYITDLPRTNDVAWGCLEFLQLPANPFLWTDKLTPVSRKRFYRAVAMQAPPNMVFIPPGTFRMGSPTNDVGRAEGEGLQTDVIISRGFWIGKYEVTQGEYFTVMGSNPSWFNGLRWKDNPRETDYGTVLSRPVETVSWNDAVAYCAALTERERAAERIPVNCVYRLPTEAEWEYACRATTSTRFSYGDDPVYLDLTNYAWYWINSDGQTHQVGQKLPNPWGLYDMHGNVSEWCQDGFGEYPGGTVLDPQAPDTDPRRIIRGGSLLGRDGLDTAKDCRSASRNYHVFGGSFIGFRVVLAPRRS